MSVQFVKSSVSDFGLAPSDENRASAACRAVRKNGLQVRRQDNGGFRKKVCAHAQIARTSFGARTQQHCAESGKRPVGADSGRTGPDHLCGHYFRR